VDSILCSTEIKGLLGATMVTLSGGHIMIVSQELVEMKEHGYKMGVCGVSVSHCERGHTAHCSSQLMEP
jgi:hypothetical protein